MQSDNALGVSPRARWYMAAWRVPGRRQPFVWIGILCVWLNYFPLLEVNVRNAIIDRSIFDGALKIAPEDKANLVLSGDLIGYDRSTLRNDDNDNTLEYRIHVTVSMTLRDMEKKEVVWSESGFVGETTYFVSGAQAKTEADAIEDALTDLARRVVERTIEDW